MKNPTQSRYLPGSTAARALLSLMAAGAAPSMFAANQTWSASPTDALWATGANWSGGAAPGTAAGGYGNTSRNNDIATFNSALSSGIGGVGNPIVIDTNRFIKGITFDTASVGSFVIGSTGGNLLQLDQGGSIVMNAAVTSSQVVNNPVQIRAQSSFNPTYTLSNNATDSNATLTIGGSLATNSSTGRGVNWTLGGSNTGNNLVTGVLSGGGSGGYTGLIKNGTGTWKLTASNTLPSVAINDGTLIAGNVNALGTAVATVNGGTLLVENLALGNSSVVLNTNGTLRGTGASASVKVVNVGAAATSVAISTTSASDVLTVGVGANSVIGGQPSSVINVSGPGTVSLGLASTYVGSWSLNSGITRLGAATALGSGSVAFGSGSTATLQLNGQSASVAGLNSNATLGAPVIENGTAGTSTLTVNTTGSSDYAGLAQDGAAGTLALAKSGAGTLNLTGANTYSGGTTVSGGTLKVNNSSGSATGSGAVSIATGGILGGSGTISGSVNVASGGIVAPGNSVGTLTVGALTSASGSIFNFEFNGSPANDRINVTNSDGLTLNGGGFNLYTENTLDGWTTTGDYNLIQYAGSIQGTGIGALSVLNPQAGYGYTFGSSGGFVTLEVFIASVLSHWNVDAGGSWNDAGNWSGAVPNGAGEGALLDQELSAPATLTLDGTKTVGGLTLDSANGYTIASGSGGTLSLDAGVSQASIIVSSGAHTISAPVALASNTVASVASGSGLTLSGQVSGNGTLTKSGAGALDLDSANTYSGGTSITGGSVGFVAGGLGSGAISVNGASLTYKGVNTDDLSAQGLSIGSGGAAIDIGANNVVYTAAITGSGAFTKGGTGTLTLQGNNTFTGSTTINGGGLVVNGSSASTGGTTLNGANTFIELAGDSSLGAVPVAPAVNLTLNAGSGNTASVKFNGPTTLAANRNISLASGTGAFDTNGNAVTVSGSLSGSGNLVKNGAGVLTLGSAASSATGSTTINDGGITAANINALPTGAITLNNNAALSLTANVAQSVGNLTVNGANTISSGSTNTIFGIGAIVGGSGSLTINGGSFVNDFTGSWSGFTGSIALGGSGSYRLNGATGSSAVAFDLGTRGISVRSNAAGITFGALSGSAGSTLTGSGGGATQAVTYTVGGLGTNTSFAGSITDGASTTALTKVGTGTLTLSGTSTYGGATTISNGAIALGANNALSANSDISITGGTLDLATFSASAKSLSVSNGVTVKFNLSSGGIDNSTALLALTNGLTETLDGGSYNIDFSGFTFDTAGSYKLFSFSGFSSTLLATDFVALNSTLSGVNGAFVLNGNDLSYSISAVPEPSSFALMAGVAGLGLAGLRRRRRA